MSADFTDVFARSEERAFGGQPLRLTSAGIWFPLPLDVIRSAMEQLSSSDFWSRFGDKPRALDAGMGDGRLVAALSAARKNLLAYGIEIHEPLSELARENLRELTNGGLPPTWRTCYGDYLDPATYPKLGVRIEEIDAFFNYPDGNEQPLATLLAEHAHPGAFLILLTPDHTLGVEGLDLQKELSVPRVGAPGFRLAVYGVQ